MQILPIGSEHEFKIIRMNEAEKKIGLSLKGAGEERDRARMEGYQQQAQQASAAFGSGTSPEVEYSEEEQ